MWTIWMTCKPLFTTSGIYNSRSEEVVFTEPNTSRVFDAIGLESISLMRRTVLSTESIPVDC